MTERIDSAALAAERMTAAVLDLVADERDRQRGLWGNQFHTPARWLAILAEEFGEVAQLINRLEFDNLSPTVAANSLQHLKSELIQVAAVAVQIVEGL